MEKLYHFKQLIKEKPRANNPADFSLIANIKHHSNTQKVLKHLEETVISYVGTEKKRKTCLICTFNMGRFSRSKTDEVTLLLRENKIVSKYVPNDMPADYSICLVEQGRFVKREKKSGSCKFQLNCTLQSFILKLRATSYKLRDKF